MKKIKKSRISIKLIILILIIIISSIIIFINKNDKITLKTIANKITNAMQYMNIKSTNYIKDENENIIYNNVYKFRVNISNANNENKYRIVINYNDNNSEIELKSMNQEYSFSLDKEGKYDINISLFENDSIIEQMEKTVYYIKPYEKQFAGELARKGINVHYISSIRDEYEIANKLLDSLGINYVRTDN